MTYKNFNTNNYLFNPNSKLGIYIIHGFSSTTYEVKKLAEYLGQQGYYVQADNLPGHGTSIEDCNFKRKSKNRMLSITPSKPN